MFYHKYQTVKDTKQNDKTIKLLLNANQVPNKALLDFVKFMQHFRFYYNCVFTLFHELTYF
jgi:hypothetical protein